MNIELATDNWGYPVESSGSQPQSSISKTFDSSGEITHEGNLNFNSIQNLYTRLTYVFEKAKVYDWDGDDAEPVSFTTYQQAVKFISYMPEGLEIPEITPDNDGYIEFEWYSNGKSFSFYVTGTNILLYASYFGINERFSGRRPFPDRFPTEFRIWINKVYV